MPPAGYKAIPAGLKRQLGKLPRGACMRGGTIYAPETIRGKKQMVHVHVPNLTYALQVYRGTHGRTSI